MDLENFLRELNAWRANAAGLHENGAEVGTTNLSRFDETLEAFSVSLEELRVAEEVLTEQNQQLLLSRQELEFERRRYQLLFDCAPDGYLVTDRMGLIREANRAASARLGVEQRHLVGKPLASFVARPDRDEFRPIINSLGKATASRHWEGRLVPRHGEPFDATLTVALLPGQQGEPGGLLWQIHDLGPWKRSQEQVRSVYDEHERVALDRTARVEAELRGKEQDLAEEHTARGEADAALRQRTELLDRVNAVVYEADAATGRFSYVSGHASTLLGRPAADWVRDPGLFARSVHPEDRALVDSQRRKYAAAGGGDYELEYRVQVPGGAYVWVRDCARMTVDVGGGAGRVWGVLVNIHKRRRAERHLYYKTSEIETRLLDMSHLYELGLRLASSHERPEVLREVLAGVTGLVGASMGVVWWLDHERGELFPECNLGLPEWYLEGLDRIKFGAGSCGRAVATGRSVVVPDVETDPTFAPWAQGARQAGFRAVLSTPIYARDGVALGALTTYFEEPHHPTERQVRLVERYADLAGRYVEYADRHLRLSAAARGKGELLALVGRELREPLAAMAGNLRLQKSPGPGGAVAEEAYRRLDQQLRRASLVVDDLIDLTREQGDELPLRREPTDLADALSRAVDEVRPLCGERVQGVTAAVPPGPLVVLADPDRLVPMLTRLLVAAARSADPGSHLRLTLRREGGAARLEIRDDVIVDEPPLPGTVLDPNEPEALWALPAGAGAVGLALVAALARRLGGSVSVSGAGPGRGIEFVLCLALSPSDEVKEPAPPPPATPAAPPRPRSALVVDDDPDTARMMARLLRIWKHDVRVARTGPEAVASAHEHPPDVVLLDIGLPGMNGYEVARVLRNSFPGRFRILGLTGYSHPEDLIEAESAGFDHYLVKPIDLDVLRHHLGLADIPHE